MSECQVVCLVDVYSARQRSLFAALADRLPEEERCAYISAVPVGVAPHDNVAVGVFENENVFPPLGIFAIPTRRCTDVPEVVGTAAAESTVLRSIGLPSAGPPVADTRLLRIDPGP